jgi:hypothetical protein
MTQVSMPESARQARAVIHASYELMHRTWVVRAHLGDVEVTAATADLIDVEPAIREQIAYVAHVVPSSFDIHLTHVLRADALGAAAEAPSLLKAREVADLLRVHVRSVYRWAGVGKLNSIRLPNGRRLFNVADVRLFAIGDAPATGPPSRQDVPRQPDASLPFERYRWFVAASNVDPAKRARRDADRSDRR